MKSFVYFGTPYVARDTLAYLIEHGYTPKLVVTSPDRKRGRGQELQPSETKAFALEKNIPVITPEKLDPHALSHIKDAGGDYAIVVAYGKILPLPLFDIFPKGIINVHYSLLPKYRGASPVEAALLHEETTTGVTIQKMAYELDAGDVLATDTVAIEPTETTRELRPRLIHVGAKLLVEILPSYEEGSLTGTPQNHSEATFAGKIAKEDGLLDLTGDARMNWNKYRAYAESPGTFFFAHKNGVQVRIKIKTARYEGGVFTPERIVPEGKSEMNYEEYLRTSASS